MAFRALVRPLLASPPSRPRATAAGFLRDTAGHVAVDVLLGQGCHAFHGERGDLGSEGLEAGGVASGECGISFSHQGAALFSVSRVRTVATAFRGIPPTSAGAIGC